MTAQEINDIMQEHAPDAVPDGLRFFPQWSGSLGMWGIKVDPHKNFTPLEFKDHAERLCSAELVVRLGIVGSVSYDIGPTGNGVVYAIDPENCERFFKADTLLEALAKAYAAVKEKSDG